jgi:hypothetical protein
VAHLPVSPAPDSHFEKEELVTGLGKQNPQATDSAIGAAGFLSQVRFWER